MRTCILAACVLIALVSGEYLPVPMVHLHQMNQEKWQLALQHKLEVEIPLVQISSNKSNVLHQRDIEAQELSNQICVSGLQDPLPSSACITASITRCNPEMTLVVVLGDETVINEKQSLSDLQLCLSHWGCSLCFNLVDVLIGEAGVSFYVRLQTSCAGIPLVGYTFPQMVVGNISKCSYTSCDSCTADDECVWCSQTQKCLSGNAQGPLCDVCQCGWFHGQCPTCSECVARSGCGWCGCRGKCVPGISEAPTSGVDALGCGEWSFGSCLYDDVDACLGPCQAESIATVQQCLSGADASNSSTGSTDKPRPRNIDGDSAKELDAPVVIPRFEGVSREVESDWTNTFSQSLCTGKLPKSDAKICISAYLKLCQITLGVKLSLPGNNDINFVLAQLDQNPKFSWSPSVDVNILGSGTELAGCDLTLKTANTIIYSAGAATCLKVTGSCQVLGVWNSDVNLDLGCVTFGKASACGLYASCDTCVNDPYCGWAQNLQQCIGGDAYGPFCDGVDGCDWFPNSCPGCGSCANKSNCYWCECDQRCSNRTDTSCTQPNYECDNTIAQCNSFCLSNIKAQSLSQNCLDDLNSSSGLSGGAKAGIAIGVIGGVSAAALGGAFIAQKKFDKRIPGLSNFFDKIPPKN